LGRRIVVITILSTATLVPGAWGDAARLGLLGGVFALRLAVSIRFRWHLGSATPAMDWLATLFYVGLNVVQAHAAQWSLAAWLTMPLGVLLVNGFQGQRSRRRALAVLLVTPTVAWLDGQPWSIAALFTLYTALFFSVVEGRGRTLERAHASLTTSHEALRQAHQELRELQERLVRQEKLSSLGLLAAGIAHEINNPMAFVTSNVTLLERDLRTALRSPELMEELEQDVLPATIDGIRRVNTIVADLRRFARGDTEDAVDFDLNHEIAAALRIAHNELKQRCRVETKLEALPPLRGRPQQVTQVLVNLFVNAGQAMAGRFGVLTVTSAREGEDVVVSVADTGTGMSEETLRRLFQPFFTTKPVGAGTGLGLAVAHGIAQAHGGELSATSELGVGSTFCLRLPLHRALEVDASPTAPFAPRLPKGLA
jgi:signal transduction histidine kinase